MKKKMRKIVCAVLLGAGILIGSAGTAQAQMPYDTYSFNYWGEEVLQPQVYLYEGMLTEQEFGTGLNFPEDMCIHGGCLYVADTGNNRVLKMEPEGKVLQEIVWGSGPEDPLSGPRGLYVTEEGSLYVADSGNGRIVEYDGEGRFLRSIGRPVTNLLNDSQEYRPMKVAVDHAGRIYVIAYGINMGLVEFDKNGEFQGFMGAVNVSVDYFTWLWKNYFSTDEQKVRMAAIVPTEYSNLFVDGEDFIYTTINNLSPEDHINGADAVRRLNPTGTDVLRRLGGYPITGDLAGRQWSSFCDIAATDYGCYYILDDAGGKVFAYDYDENSLFVFGRKGTKKGNVQKPAAIAVSTGEEKVYVLDSILGGILEFQITDYGRLLMDALRLNDAGDAEGALARWQEVLEYNANHEMAYIGLGKACLAGGDYREAMEYFELGNSRKYYDKAFYYRRKELMEAGFGTGILVLFLLAAVVVGCRLAFRFRRWVGEVRCFMSKR